MPDFLPQRLRWRGGGGAGHKKEGLEKGKAEGAKGPLSAGLLMPRAGAIIVHSEEQHGLTG